MRGLADAIEQAEEYVRERLLAQRDVARREIATALLAAEIASGRDPASGDALAAVKRADELLAELDK